jgi:putative membrane protein
MALMGFGAAACSDTSSNMSNSTTTNKAITANNNTAKMENANTANSGNSNANADRSSADFWKKAAEGGMAEVELSKVAQTKAQNAEVKKFAQTMVTDHTKANDELKALAAKKSVTLPTELDAAHKSTLDKLKGLSGAEFDKAYVDAMVSDHDAAVDLFKKQAGDGSDGDLKSFAAKTLPTLEGHQKMIMGIQGKMK